MANEYAVNEADLQKVADSIKNAARTTQKLAFPDGWSDIVDTLGAKDGSIIKYVGDSFELVSFIDLSGNVISVSSAPEGIVSTDISSGLYVWVTALNAGLTTITVTTDASENNEYKYVIDVNFARYSGAYKVTPGRTEQVLPTKNKGLSDNITVVGDPNLLPENIKAGTTIFGIPGTHSINVDINLTVGSSATVSGEDFKSGNAIIDPTKSITITPTGVVTAEWDMDTDVKITAVAVGMATVYLPSPDGGIAAQIIVSVNSSGGSSGSAKLVDFNIASNGIYTPEMVSMLLGTKVDGFKNLSVKVPTLTPDHLDVTKNGFYKSPDGTAYTSVNVEVMPSGKKTITANGLYDVSGYLEAEVNVPTNGEAPKLTDIKINENKTVYASEKGVDGFSKVVVEVQPKLEELDTITENGTYKPSAGYDGFSEFVVNVPTKEPELEEKTITENGEYTPSEEYDGFSKVIVNVQSTTGGSGTLTINDNGEYDVTKFAKVNVQVAEIVLPSFAVDGTLYNFVEGLTWGAWIECTLNKDGFSYDENFGIISDRGVICVSQNDPTGVQLTDKIIANHNYTIIELQ